MATYKLKLQLSDGTEITAGTFTVPDGGGGTSSVLNLNFQNGKTVITEAEFQKFKNPALVIYGAVVDPTETAVYYKALRMTNSFYDNDFASASYVFEQNGTTLTAKYDYESEEYSYTIEGGYGTTTFTIDGTSYKVENGMTWRVWVSSEYNTDDFGVFGSYISNQSGDTWVVDENEDSVSPDTKIIGGYDYFIYAP